MKKVINVFNALYLVGLCLISFNLIQTNVFLSDSDSKINNEDIYYFNDEGEIATLGSTNNSSLKLRELGFSDTEIQNLDSKQVKKMMKYDIKSKNSIQEYYEVITEMDNDEQISNIKTKVTKEFALQESDKIKKEKTDNNDSSDSLITSLSSSSSVLLTTTCDESNPTTECTTDDAVSKSAVDSQINYVRITVTVIALNEYQVMDSNSNIIQGNFFVKTTIDWLTIPTFQLWDVIGISASEYTKIVPEAYFAMQTQSWSQEDPALPGSELTNPDSAVVLYDPDNLSYFNRDITFGGGVSLIYNMLNLINPMDWEHRISIWAETYYDNPSMSIYDDNDITVLGGFAHETFGLSGATVTISLSSGLSVSTVLGTYYDPKIELSATLTQSDIILNASYDYTRPDNWEDFTDPTVTIKNEANAWLTYDNYFNLKKLGFNDFEINKLTPSEISIYSQYEVLQIEGIDQTDSHTAVAPNQYMTTTISILTDGKLFIKQNVFWEEDKPIERQDDLIGIKFPTGTTFLTFYAKQMGIYSQDPSDDITNYSYSSTPTSQYSLNSYGFIIKMNLFDNNTSSARDLLFLTTNVVLTINNTSQEGFYVQNGYYRHAKSDEYGIMSSDFYMSPTLGIVVSTGFETKYYSQVSNLFAIQNPYYVPSC